jgi:hypothetical protein
MLGQRCAAGTLDSARLRQNGPAYRLLDATLNNEYTLRHLATGIDEPRGFVMQWVWRKMLKRRYEERRVQA